MSIPQIKGLAAWPRENWLYKLHGEDYDSDADILHKDKENILILLCLHT